MIKDDQLDALFGGKGAKLNDLTMLFFGAFLGILPPFIEGVLSWKAGASLSSIQFASIILAVLFFGLALAFWYARPDKQKIIDDIRKRPKRTLADQPTALDGGEF